jgi:DNA-binding transcriptional regulator YhcF (GntR family)
MEQLLHIEYNSGIPVYKQLINLIITAVNNEQLLIGEKLPPLRKLAEQLNINVNTVAKVYKELELKGVVKSYAGKGCFILKPETQRLSTKDKSTHIERLYNNLLSEAKSFSITDDDVKNFILGRL